VGKVKLSFTRHISDLWRRLEWPVVVLVAGAFLAYSFRYALIDWLHAPLLANLAHGPVTAPTEFQSAACLLVGVWLSIPVGMLQLVSAVVPMSRRRTLELVAASAACLVLGVMAAYLVLPLIIGALSGIHIADFRPFILAETYLLFVINFLGVAAIVSQLPLLFLILDRTRPLDFAKLLLWQKWVALGAVLACFVLPTAPEPLSQLILALVIIASYELSLTAVWLSRNHRRVLAVVRRPATQAAVVTPAAAPAPKPVARLARPAAPVLKPAAQPAPAPRRAKTRPMDRPSGPAVIDMRPKEH
jgi:Sec-independent protein secretion pathway component TatC